MDKLSGLASKFGGKGESHQQQGGSSSGGGSGGQEDYLDKGMFLYYSLAVFRPDMIVEY